jgi:hypothetical protein
MQKMLFLGLLCGCLWACHESNPSLQALKLPQAKRHFTFTGVSFVAPPKPFEEDPMQALRDNGVGWISVIPYAFTRQGEAVVHYSGSKQWWGESIEGVTATIQKARLAGIKIMLKPQLYVPGAWTGDLDFPTEQAWENWEQDYERYILTFAKVAADLNVEIFCVGTEFRNHIKKRPTFWPQLIDKVRAQYHGQVTYAANWDDFDAVPFWHKLDFIGINAYFPLKKSKTPSPHDLLDAWQPYLQRIESYAKTQGKSVAFTEFGYLSVDGCAGKTWKLEKNIKQLKVNELAQAHALDALLHACSERKWWRGGFVWKWFPNMHGHEGYLEKDYTPQDKLAEKVLAKWYCQAAMP